MEITERSCVLDDTTELLNYPEITFLSTSSYGLNRSWLGTLLLTEGRNLNRAVGLSKDFFKHGRYFHKWKILAHINPFFFAP